MNLPKTRRHFLADVGRGTLLATIGPALAAELGIVPKASAGDSGDDRLRFGSMEPLVCFMQETPVEKLQQALMEKLAGGVSLERMIAAGALANARTFGGEDYTGFHTLMALRPALRMSQTMPEKERALPVFKVLYRNTARIQENGGRKNEVLHEVAVPAELTPPTAEELRAAVRGKNPARAEEIFARLALDSPEAAFNALLTSVHDDTEVHRTVLPYRAWDLLDVVGREHAHTLLRQSLRYCLRAENWRRAEWDEHSRVLARLLDEHRLTGREPGTKPAEDSFIDQLCGTIFNGTPEQAAGAVAAALAEGFEPAAIGEAVSLAANQLVLRDHGRTPEMEVPGKPVGSVHGDSIGVHASDSANAWRNLAGVSTGNNVYACLILGAWQAAMDRTQRGGDFQKWQPVPAAWQLDQIKSVEPAKLLADLDSAIRQNLQAQAGALVHKCGQLNHPVEPVFGVLLRYAVSEDGSLHAEKYYQTVREEFQSTRPVLRWRHLTALARVTASEYGRPAAGQAEARQLLGV